MKGYSIILLLSAVSAAPSLRVRDEVPGVVAASIQKVAGNSTGYTGSKASGPLSPAVIYNEQDYYAIDFTVGTPPQAFNALIDTGSSDIYVYDTQDKVANSVSNYYDHTKSSTYKFVQSGFSITYADGSGASGNLVEDTLTINGGAVSIKGANFADASSGNEKGGIDVFGIGLSSNEATLYSSPYNEYDNFPIQLKKQGYTQALAYSLYLDDYNTSSGTVLFGGVDSAKYTGPLVTFPLQNPDSPGQTPNAFFINVQSATVTKGTTVNAYSSSFSGLLDSGTTLTYAPSSFVTAVAKQLGFTKNSSGDYVKLQTATASDAAATVNYKLSNNLTIKVPASQLTLPYTDQNGNPITNSNGVPYEYLGIIPNGGGDNILGDTFLRAAYVVYDLDHLQVSLAQTKFDSATSNVQVITSSGIPGAVKPT